MICWVPRRWATSSNKTHWSGKFQTTGLHPCFPPVISVKRPECIFLTLVKISEYDLNELWKYCELFVLGTHIIFRGKIVPIALLRRNVLVSSISIPPAWWRLFAVIPPLSRPFGPAVLLRVSRPTQLVPPDWEIMLASSSAYFVWLS